MKKLNVFLMIVLILLIAFAVYFFIGGQLQTSVSTMTAKATEYPDAFASICSVLSSGAAPQQFSGEVPASADGWTLVDTTISLTNRGLFDAEWIDVSVEGAPGDLAVYSLTGEGSDVPARSVGQINLKLITAASESVRRTIRINYYVYGMHRTLSLVA